MSVSARISVVGEIDVKEPDDTVMTVPLGLLLRFETVEDMLQALQDGSVTFSFGGEATR